MHWKILFTVLLSAGFLLLTGCASSKLSQSDHYQIDSEKVYWVEKSFLAKGNKKKKIFSADVSSFRELKYDKYSSNKYALDSNYVYLNGVPIPFADPLSFKIISKKYARDENHLFFNGQKVADVNPSEFKLINESSISSYNFGIVGNRVVTEDRSFFPCDAKSYRLHDEHPGVWSYDLECAYYEGHKLPTIDPSSFQVLTYHFAKDASQIFFHDRVLINADPDTFEVSKYSRSAAFVARDKSYCWNWDGLKVDCNLPTEAGAPLASMGAVEMQKAANRIVGKWWADSKKSKQEAMANQSSTQAEVLKFYKDQVLFREAVNDIDLSDLSIGYSYSLQSTTSDFIGTKSKYTYVLKEKKDSKLYFDVFNNEMYGVLTEIRNIEGQILQAAHPSKFFAREKSYKGVECIFIVGECIDEETSFGNNTNQLKKTFVQINYEKGVWSKSTLDKGVFQLKQKGIYDKMGFPLYLIKFRDDELDNEYLRIE